MNYQFQKVSYLLLLTVCLLPLPCFSQDTSASASLSLSQAIEKAVRQHPRIKMVQHQIEASEERIVQARSGFLPQIDFTQTVNRTNNPMWHFGTKLNQESVSASDFDPDRLNDPDGIENFNSTLSVVWNIFDSGQSLYGTKQAMLGRDVASLALEQTRQQVMAGAAIAYAGVLLSYENLRVVDQSLNSALAHLKMIEDRFQAGFVVKSDVLRAQVRIAQLEQDKCSATCQVDIARAILNTAMNEPLDSVYELTSSFESQDIIEDDLEHWVELGLKNRRDYLQLAEKEAIARQEIEKAKAANLPSLNLFGNYEINSEKFGDLAHNYTVGAMLRVNLFAGHRDTAKIREASAALKEVLVMRQEFESNIRLEIRQAFLQSKSAFNRIQVAQRAVSQSEETLRIVSDRYKNGLLTIIDLLDAEVALEQSRKSLFQALHDYKVSSVRLELAAGTLGNE